MVRSTSPEQREKIVARYRRSGVTQREFAEREGIRLATLQSWIYRPSESRGAQPRFIELDRSAVRLTAGPIEIRVGEVRLVVPETVDVARVVAIVAGLAREAGGGS